MIIFGRFPAVIYIKKSSLDFFLDKNEAHLEFPPDTVKDSDIIDSVKYQKLVEDFLTANKLTKQKVLFILSEEVFFQKVIPFTDEKMLDEEFLSFISMLPIESEKLRKKYLKLDGDVYFFGINKWVIEKLIEILSKLSWEVIAAVPVSLFTDEKVLNQQTIKNIFSNRQLIKVSDFLSDKASTLNSKASNAVVYSAISILIVLLSLIFFYFSQDILFPMKQVNISHKLTEKVSTNSASLSATDSAKTKPATESAAIDKSKLKVKVLNGTGIAGQAATVRDSLVELGWSEIETGNAEGASSDTTVVIFSSNVSEDLRKEIIDALEENFEDVSVQDDSDLQEFNILITTGKAKAF